MNIAILITAYHKTEQLSHLIECLGKRLRYSNIYLHFDQKSHVDEAWIKSLKTLKVNIIRKYKVYWGGFNQLKSIISLVSLAVQEKKYDYLILISGQDMPIKSYESLVKFLIENNGKSFIDSHKLPIEYLNYNQGFGRVQWFWFLDYIQFRGVHRLQKIGHYIFEKLSIVKPSAKGIEFYAGSDWWMLPGPVAEYCVKEFNENVKLVSCFKNSFIPSEMFFQTAINNSEFSKTIVNNNKRYTEWENGSAHPKCITADKISQVLNSDCYFARKFDMAADPVLFNDISLIF